MRDTIPGTTMAYEDVRADLEAHFENEHKDRWRLRRAESAKDMTGRELNVEVLRKIMPLNTLSAKQIFLQAQREAEMGAEVTQE